MQFILKTGQLENQKADCIIIPIYESQTKSSLFNLLNNHTKKYLVNFIKSGEIAGKLGQTLLLHDVPHLANKKILLLGCGKEQNFSQQAYRTAMHSMSQALKKSTITEAICLIDKLTSKEKKHDLTWNIQQTILIVTHSLYKFEAFKSKANITKAHSWKKVIFMVDKNAAIAKLKATIEHALATSAGITLSRNLSNTPANVCTPSYLATQAKTLAKEYKSLSCKVLEKKDMQKLKMGSLLSVAQGSPQPPKLIILHHKGAKNTLQPIVLVGKGITFDTGGNSLKPAGSMIGMKYDMCGAATVIGMLKFAAAAKLPLNVIGVIAAAENTPGGYASRPDDIVTSMSGTTIEILNTDAEGRLVLCDALTYCEKFKPKAVIDIATLTGACVVALGRHHSALYGNNQKLVDQLMEAGRYSHDKCWHMPMGAEYKEQLTSNFADIANIGGPEAGSITAACFLGHFTGKFAWAHLDVAGTACRFSGKEKSATGQPMALLAQYLMSCAQRST